MVEKYDTVSRGWVPVASLNEARECASASVIYIPIPSSSSDDETFPSSSLPARPSTSSSPSSPTFQPRIVLSGGWDGFQVMNSVEVFDPLSNTWTLYPNALQQARECHSTVPISSRPASITSHLPPSTPPSCSFSSFVLSIGGWDGYQPLCSVESFEPFRSPSATSSTSSTFVSSTLSSLVEARNRPSAVVLEF
eukprot:GILI01029262.1.p1 GENE.GILI01029262.1~~GILI01029262.1.p1  ORF type:complete len:202 (-),score=30.27 GILI01029262.1:63-644(-)